MREVCYVRVDPLGDDFQKELLTIELRTNHKLHSVLSEYPGAWEALIEHVNVAAAEWFRHWLRRTHPAMTVEECERAMGPLGEEAAQPPPGR